MESFLNYRYTLNTLTQLLQIQKVHGVKMDIYIHKDRPYPFGDIDELILNIETSELTDKLNQLYKSLFAEIKKTISLWEEVEDLLPLAREYNSQRYHTAHFFISLNRSLNIPLTVRRLLKKENGSFFEGIMGQDKCITEDGSEFIMYGKIEWHSLNGICKEEVDSIYFPESFEYIFLGKLINKCDIILEKLKHIGIDDRKPFDHEYTPNQIDYIANSLVQMGRINDVRLFCNIMNGKLNGQIKWLKDKGFKSDLKTFLHYFLKTVEYSELGIPSVTKSTLPWKEINNLFIVKMGKLQKDGKYNIKKGNDFEVIFKNLPE